MGMIEETSMSSESVPENKIAILRRLGEENNLEYVDLEHVKKIITPLSGLKKRGWFSSHFYKCLPLAIGNAQGFVVSLPFEFNVMWNGGDDPKDILFKFEDFDKKEKSKIDVSSHFGNGVFTINLPFIIKTPQNVDLMTTSPPNFLTPGLSPLSAVIETDNLKYTFGLSIKIDILNTWIKILPYAPLVGLLPIPRNFCSQFELIDGDKDMSPIYLTNEKLIAEEHAVVRSHLSNMFYGTNKSLDRTYFEGMDIRGNKFKNRQKFKIRKRLN
jgi:hypothetical protein